MSEHPLSFSQIKTFKPNREELAWAAGFFDGEGHITAQLRRGIGKGAGLERRSLRLTINQADPQVLHRFRAAVGGSGSIAGPRHYVSGTQAWYYWSQNYEETQAIAAMLWGWLSPVKRQQAATALATMRAYYANPLLRNLHRTAARRRKRDV